MVNPRAKNRKTLKTQASSDLQSTQSGAIIGSNDDLLTEILLRLPVNSILRFKSVSKHWKWLLSHRRFTLLHDNLSKSPGLFVDNTYVPFNVENQSTPFRSLDFYFDRSVVNIVQSCNGLLLCSIRPKGSKSAPKYYVFNPTTKQLATIPPVPGGLKVHKTIRFMCLAYHQTDCPRYKLVCIRSLDSHGELFQIQIYSSDAGKWKVSIRKVSIQSFSSLIPFFVDGVYCNGAVYWAPRRYNNSLNHDIFYFKLDVEQLQMLPLPVGLMSSGTATMCFGESRGHLHLIPFNILQENILRLNVYEMFSDYSGWFVKYQLQLDALPGAFPDMIFHRRFGYHLEFIDVVRGEEEEDTFLVLKTPENIITYNVHDKSFKHIFSFTKHSYISSSLFHRYTETLSSF